MANFAKVIDEQSENNLSVWQKEKKELQDQIEVLRNSLQEAQRSNTEKDKTVINLNRKIAEDHEKAMQMRGDLQKIRRDREQREQARILKKKEEEAEMERKYGEKHEIVRQNQEYCEKRLHELVALIEKERKEAAAKIAELEEKLRRESEEKRKIKEDWDKDQASLENELEQLLSKYNRQNREVINQREKINMERGETAAMVARLELEIENEKRKAAEQVAEQEKIVFGKLEAVLTDVFAEHFSELEKNAAVELANQHERNEKWVKEKVRLEEENQLLRRTMEAMRTELQKFLHPTL